MPRHDFIFRLGPGKIGLGIDRSPTPCRPCALGERSCGSCQARSEGSPALSSGCGAARADVMSKLGTFSEATFGIQSHDGVDQLPAFPCACPFGGCPFLANSTWTRQSLLSRSATSPGAELEYVGPPLDLCACGDVEANPGPPKTSSKTPQSQPVYVNCDEDEPGATGDMLGIDADLLHQNAARAARFAAPPPPQQDTEFEAQKRAYLAQRATDVRVVRSVDDPLVVAANRREMEREVAIHLKECTCPNKSGGTKQGRHCNACPQSKNFKEGLTTITAKTPHLSDDATCIIDASASATLVCPTEADLLLILSLPTADEIPASAVHSVAAALSWLLRQVASANSPAAWRILMGFGPMILSLDFRQRGSATTFAKTVKQRCITFMRDPNRLIVDTVTAATSRRHNENTGKNKVGDSTKPWDEGMGDELLELPSAQAEKKSAQQARRGFLTKSMRTLRDTAVAAHTPGNTAALQALFPVCPPPVLRKDQQAVDVSSATAEDVNKSLRSFNKGSAAGIGGLSADHLRPLCKHTIVMQPLCEVLTIIMQGKVPSVVATLVFGAQLTGLHKKTGGLRPIAAGNTLRRLATKILLNREKTSIAQFFRKAPGGQVGVGQKCGCEVLFHTVRRFQCVMSSSQDEVRALDFKNAFGNIDRSLLLDVVQRDFPSLGPISRSAYSATSFLLFGNEVVRSTQGVQQGDPSGPLLFSLALAEVQRWVIDELAVQGLPAPELVGSYLDDIVVGGRKDEVQTYVDTLQQIGSTTGLLLNESKCVTNPTALVGGCLSEVEADIDDAVQARVTSAAAICRLVGAFGQSYPQEASWLLRSCAGRCLVQYSQRLHGQHRLWDVYDECIRNTSADILGLSTPMAHSHLSVGGLGFLTCSHVAAPALAASCMEARLVEHIINVDSLHPIQHDVRFRKAVATLGQTAISDASVATKPQKKLTAPFDDAIDVAALATLSPEGKARATAATKTFASLWLTQHVSCSAEQFRVLVRHRFASPIAAAPTLCSCGLLAGVDGLHSLSCMRTGLRQKLHASVCKALTYVASQALLAPLREYTFGPGAHRADVALREDTTTLLDFGFTTGDPTAYAQVKLNKYKDVVPPGHTLAPLIIGVDFAWEPSALPTLKRITGRHAARFELGAAGAVAAMGRIMSPIFCGVADILAFQARRDLDADLPGDDIEGRGADGGSVSSEPPDADDDCCSLCSDVEDGVLVDEGAGEVTSGSGPVVGE